MSDAVRDDEYWMQLALDEAKVAASRGEVPVGCVLVDSAGQLVSRAHNLRETLQDPTGHAEMLALRWASMDKSTWRLTGMTAYVTLEPCPMCAGALVNARIDRVVWGCDDPKAGAVRSLFAIGQDARLNHRFEITSGVLAEPCAAVLRAFFAQLRARSREARSNTK